MGVEVNNGGPGDALHTLKQELPGEWGGPVRTAAPGGRAVDEGPGQRACVRAVGHPHVERRHPTPRRAVPLLAVWPRRLCGGEPWGPVAGTGLSLG